MSTPAFVSPATNLSAFNCPHCHAYAKQEWMRVIGQTLSHKSLVDFLQVERHPETVQRMSSQLSQQLRFYASKCSNCDETAYWLDESLVWPRKTSAPPANSDMPDPVHEIYDEAAAIMADSPRAAAAMLRLAVEMLCNNLMGKDGNLADYINKWVAEGLDKRIEKALDTVRVVGNLAIHGGKINVEDDLATVEMLFWLINYIVEKKISEPNRIDEFFDRNVPPDEQKKSARRNRPPETRHGVVEPN